MPPRLYISINSPERIEWEGEANALSSENSQGPFDILPGHTNFITMIEGGKPIIIHRGDGDISFSFRSAVVSVRSDTVTIHANL